MPKPPRKKGLGPEKKHKKKTSILTSEHITWVDYKDVNLLRRFMSERAKIRARRVSGNDQQQQAAVARAIKVAREMALLPYSVRQVQQRSKGKGRDRDRDRDMPTEAELEATDTENEVEELERAEEEGEVEDALPSEVAETIGSEP
jgi:small subunit ribosomal protein S18